MAGASGIQISRRRTDIVDVAVRALFEPFEGSGMALAALGGYGRREMTPGSDIDLLFVHEGLGEDQIRPVVDAVLYPLWDAGMALSHAVRTIEECRSEAAARVESLTTVLDARLLAGSKECADAALAAVTHVAARDLGGLAHRLKSWRNDRGERYGHAGRMLEPDLKESMGGLRDIPVVRWIGLANGIDGCEDWWDLRSDRDWLLLVRWGLHRASGSRSTRLSADHHQAITDLLALAAEPGWESRDVLARRVFFHARSVDDTVSEVLLREHVLFPGVTRVAAAIVGNLDPPMLLSLIQEGVVHEGVLLSPDLASKPLRLLPAWEGVRGRPQRDPYHQYPVDVHLTETVNEAIRLLREPAAQPFAVEAARLISDPTPLLLGALLHDIGKVGKGSHVEEGVNIAAEVLQAMEAEPDVSGDVLFLVREHLLLSDTATRRNLEDEDLILEVAARVGDPRRLALLYLLTVADARATGPSASTPWRMNLIRDLVSKVSHAFERGLIDRDQAGRLEVAREGVRQALLSAGAPRGRVEEFLEAVPSGYLLSVEPSGVTGDAQLIIPPPDQDDVRVHIAGGNSPETYRVAIGMVDRIGLLAAVAGSFTLSGLAIVSAQAFTTAGGAALDVFEVRGAFEEDVDPQRWAKFEDTLRRAIEGRIDLASAVSDLRSHYRREATETPISVKVDQEASDFFTVIEVAAPDRMGLLFDLAKTLADQGLDVHVAKVATYGPRVVDVFYVRDQEGQKVLEADQVALVEALTTAASS